LEVEVFNKFDFSPPTHTCKHEGNTKHTALGGLVMSLLHFFIVSAEH